MPGERWSIIVHGGAKEIASELHERNRAGCLAAVSAGAAVLAAGGNALDAAEAAIRALEDDPVFNAGYGSVLNEAGEVEMDSAMMDGGSLEIGAVACVRRVRNPVRIARALLPDRTVLLAGDGAEQFARQSGIPLCDPAELISPEKLASENSKAHDTVGCVVRDGQGRIVAATSTGGLPGKRVGRIGDSPIPGSGFYADNQLGGTAFSGDGEAVLRTMLAARVMQALEAQPPQAAGRVAIEALARVGGEAGAIVLDRNGRFGVAHNSAHFALALHASDLDEPRAALTSKELEDILHG